MIGPLVIGAPTTTYGVHTNAGAIFIYDADSFEFLAKIHSDRSLGIYSLQLLYTIDIQ